MVASALESGKLVTVLDEYAPRPLGLYAVRSGKHVPPALKHLLELLSAEFRGPAWRVAQR